MNVRFIGTIAVALATGTAIGAGGMYMVVLKPLLTIQALSSYKISLAEAKLLVRELEELRSNNNAQLQSLLEAELDTKLLNAEAYEALEPSWRDKEAEESIARVRKYRSVYPSQQTDKQTLESLQRILAGR